MHLLGHHNKIPQTGWLKQHTFIPHTSRCWKCNSRCQAIGSSGEPPLPGWLHFPCPSHGRERRRENRENESATSPVSLLFFLFFFLHFRMIPAACSIWKFPGQGSNRSYSCQPTPQPQQQRIQAASVTYTTGHVNTRFLTHWARPEIEPASSWILISFLNAASQWELC